MTDGSKTGAYFRPAHGRWYAESPFTDRAPTVFTDDSGTQHTVAYGDGTDVAMGPYEHRWSNGKFYKHPEVPTAGFDTIAHLDDMFVSQCSSVSDLYYEENGDDYLWRGARLDLLRIFIACGVVLTLWGPPGHAKTRIVESLNQLTDDEDKHFFVRSVQWSTEDPTIMKGIKYTTLDDDGSTTVMRSSVPDLAHEIITRYRETGRKTIILSDEVSLANNSQRGAALGALTHNMIGDYFVGYYSTYVMGANPKNTVDGVTMPGQQFIRRGGHIYWFTHVDEFYEGWSEGFGNPKYVPEAMTDWYMQGMIYENNEVTPMRGSWKPSALVPYDRMEQSDRTLTDWAKLVTFINGLMVGKIADPLRHAYLKEATLAMLGPANARKMADLCNQEHEAFVSADFFGKAVEDLGITASSGIATVRDRLRNKLYDGYLTGGDPMRSDQLSAVLDQVRDRIASRTIDTAELRRMNNLVWCLLVTSGNGADRNMILPLCEYLAFDSDGLAWYIESDGHDFQVAEAVPKYVKESDYMQVLAEAQRRLRSMREQ